MSYVEPPTEPDYVSMGSGRPPKSIPEIRGDLQRLAEENAGTDEHFRRFCEDLDTQLRDALAPPEEREGQVTVSPEVALRFMRHEDTLEDRTILKQQLVLLNSTTHNPEEG